MKVGIRKTPQMRFLELERGTPIDELILLTLRDSKGEYTLAARELGIDISTLSRWIDKLALGEPVNSIRIQSGHLPSNNLEFTIRDNSRIAMCVEDKCRDCKITFPEILKPTFVGVISDISGMYAVINEKPHGKLVRSRKHMFLLNRSEIATLLHPSDEVH